VPCLHGFPLQTSLISDALCFLAIDQAKVSVNTCVWTYSRCDYGIASHFDSLDSCGYFFTFLFEHLFD
jgi:hypothetical protein